MADNCNGCGSTPTPPCVDCGAVLQTVQYCDDGCVDTVNSECVIWNGDLVTLPDGSTFTNLSNLNDILKKIATAGNGVTITATFNNASRTLTIKKNGVTAASVVIPDSDDNYLALSGKRLQIWKPTLNGDGSTGTPVKLSDIDLSGLFTETAFAATSNSLVIVPSGTNGHQPQIELVPSTDTGNALIQGTDGKPYVPTPDFGIADVVINNIQGITWTRSVSGGVISYTPVIDWTYFASQICPLCSPSCGAPSNLTVQTA